ncbi:MAG: 50S ribosome-binding GTPase [Deltaproteobacteria bacterium]|nr:50S ribosome-binding GTPase [Deltaproteobacteria bacterium]
MHARSDAALRAANARLTGALSERVGDVRARLIDAASLVEATIDFEEADVGDVRAEEILAPLRTAAEGLGRLADSYRRGRVFREGALAVITGRPNVGKSSLLNALAGRRRAIVAPTPGTTRDAVEDDVDIAGVPFRLVDTAGLRAAPDAIESEGIAIARERAAEADLVLFVFDASAGWTAEDEELRRGLPPAPVLDVANKRDLLPNGLAVRADATTCAVSGAGVEELGAKMAALVSGDDAGARTPRSSRTSGSIRRWKSRGPASMRRSRR